MDFPELVSEYRERLRRLAELRLGQNLRGRVDASDVVQEALMDAHEQFDNFQKDPQVSPYVWLRFFLCQRIIRLYRTHVEAQKRDVRREISIDNKVGPSAQSSIMAIQLFDRGESPTQVVEKQESLGKLIEALDSMDEVDREIIALRSFEQLSVQETADLLEITPDAVYKRHARALLRLKDLTKKENGN